MDAFIQVVVFFPVLELKREGRGGCREWMLVLNCIVGIVQDMRSFLIIVPDQGYLFEAAGMVNILEQANRLRPDLSSAPLYEYEIVSTQSHRIVHDRSGLNLLADHRLCDLDPVEERDTVVVTGRGVGASDGVDVADWLRRAAPHARRVVSVCGGAMLLAESGVLDGRRATTHWRLLDTMQKSFPKVRVERGPIYVEDGPFWTSAGVTSGFDLTLALIEADYGFSLARSVAQDLVMFLRRPGGQSQFSRYLLNQAGQPGPIRDLQSWILEHLSEDLSVERLAERVAMSPRNFTRVFTRETGTPPARFVEEARLDAARHRLEQGRENLDEIAGATGFGNRLNLRRVFERNLRLNPTEYRERFCSRVMA